MFTDGEIDWNVLTELLKKLPEDVRIRVPGPFSTGGSFWKIEPVGSQATRNLDALKPTIHQPFRGVAWRGLVAAKDADATSG